MSTQTANREKFMDMLATICSQLETVKDRLLKIETTTEQNKIILAQVWEKLDTLELEKEMMSSSESSLDFPPAPVQPPPVPRGRIAPPPERIAVKLPENLMKFEE